MTLDFLIDSENTCWASYIEGWNFSIFGNPKLSIVCGNCHSLFKTRDYYPTYCIDSEVPIVMTPCPHCEKWNKMDIQIPT